MAITPLNTNTEEMIKDVDMLARDLEKLKSVYEQYFLGLERKEPVKQREQVSNLIRKYAGSAMQNVRLKFKYQQLVARYNTFTSYWDRVLKEIEEGRYERDVFKYKIHHKNEEKEKIDPMLSLFNQFVTERKKCKEETKGLSFEKFKTQMQAQVQALKQKKGIGEVKFSVVTENGKAKIKATPQATKPK